MKNPHRHELNIIITCTSHLQYHSGQIVLLKPSPMNNQDFTFSFKSTRAAAEVFKFIADPNNWWIGLFGETLEGKSEQVNDAFSFKAGNGVHYSLQRLIEMQPDAKIVWLVTESNLSFLHEPGEWVGTTIRFDIAKQANTSIVTFTHHASCLKLNATIAVSTHGHNICAICRQD